MLPASEHTFEGWDGTELFCRSWRPEDPPNQRAVIPFHRGHEHSGRWQDVIEKLDLPGFS
jgi:alpha-beta hydrolase superfamily lysophospholipase